MHTRAAKLDWDAEHIFDTFEALAQSNGFSARRNGDALSVTAPLGEVIFDRASDGVSVRFEAGTPAELQLFTDLYAQRFTKLGYGKSVVWDKVAERAPLNQVICTIESKTRISANFARVRLAGDFSAFLKPGSGLHFRLLFGPEEADWPYLDDGGLTQWPGGVGVWHRPPYTVRRIDPDGGWIDVDIVLHDGGRVTDWWATVEPGEEIAIHGPSGSKQPAATWLALFGDETALPVIAHMLERAPTHTKGHATLVVRDESDVQHVAAPDDFDLTWITNGDVSGIHAAIAGLELPHEDRFVFFAGERSDASAIRSVFKKLGLADAECKAASYWSRAL